MSEVNIVLEEFEVLLHKLILAAHRGDEKALESLDMVKEWLNNN
ncbi:MULTISPECIES: hypothetical protein [Bacillus cereus group]|nr:MULTISPECIES: hypothetical protein [unclassified Bacillus cereus group]MDA2666899.1 hypothetical protein [Bacillus cereus group sp. Bc032]MDA2677603.1 hypothetical protein [Bacillus cereus group sp. Bc031]MDA2683092.1 hypothetical protein [Bacillus cereus group sp. Bc029]MDA2688535.1 hypothetical protein [Bacillus cereus group sp. Bc030]MDA2744058.1 hypothetical protein [Bacillus cereus group sp. Bc011]